MNEEEKQDSTSLPYHTTTVTGFVDSFYDIKSDIPSFLLYIFLIVIGGIGLLIYIVISLVFGNPPLWLLVFSVTCVAITSVFLLILFYKMYRPLQSLDKGLIPMRMQTKLDMYPIESEDIVKDFYSRLKQIFQLEDKDKCVFNKEINGKKGVYKFDIFSEYFFGKMHLIIFCLILFSSSWLTLSETFNDLPWYFLMSLLSIITVISVLIFITCIYQFQIYTVKHIKEKLTVDDIINFKDSVEYIVRRKWKKPIFSAIISDQSINSEIIEYVQSKKGKIKGKDTITLVEKTETRFKLIWTDY